MKPRLIELRFPAAGVSRRLSYQETVDAEDGAHATPWAVNVRPECRLARRLRGGNRPGLEQYIAESPGLDIVALAAIPTASTSGVKTVLAVVADSALGMIDDGVFSAPTGELLTDTGEVVLTDAGEPIMATTGAVPSVCVLAGRGGKAYAIHPAGVVILDLATGVVEDLVATAGSIPAGCRFGCVWRDRLVLAGGGNVIYMSRQGDFSDWGYGADVGDQGRALFFQLSAAGQIGEAATALVPHEDAFLLAATANGLWVISGDPATGTLRNVSPDIGMVGESAWALAGATVYFLARTGLYSVQVSGEDLRNISSRIPEELLDVTEAWLGYCHDERGVYLFTDRGSWFFDLGGRKGFWPDVFRAEHAPRAVCKAGDTLLLACADGYLRTLGGVDDDGSAIVSHLLIGPVRTAPPGMTAILAEVQAALASSSDTVSLALVIGDTAEQAAESAKAAIAAHDAGEDCAGYVFAEVELGGGRSIAWHPRANAPWVVLWLRSEGTWAYESIVTGVVPAGRWR